ncbi:SGNH/GDSL hydrolase family protein [Mucilaginibacter conchicola]|uniref:SGNH/GDSL hydrolase family protein n=1 Tax=Mucilaginibacter conchicola TaxID=2303333 RepID=A0A372NVK0_9SPHI|nr:SGNH/GDSL hydrolase family protein [Mucilaginibacter conchicola]RFZ94042.1 SGNH/GDSL hydrolase family protein [Mucilaginibacter conchicola]
MRLPFSRHFLIGFLALLAISSNTFAQGDDTKWKGFERVNFLIEGHKAWYVKPVHELAGKPWVWRSSFHWWHTDMDSILLTRGVYVAYLDADDQYGSPASMQLWDKFYNYMAAKGFALKPALETISRGALYTYAWAKRNPDKVSCIYAETPVCDVTSWPGAKGKGIGDEGAWKQFLQVFHFTEAEAMAYRGNPIDSLDALAAFKVPFLNIINPADRFVPPSENSDVLVQRYRALGGKADVILEEGQPEELYGHHFKITHPEKIADFLLNNSYPVKSNLPYHNYFNVRNGASHFNEAVKRKTATVAFLGGSITFNPGWREKVCKYLQERYLDTKFRFINAGIPSLGSLPHAFRFKRDVLDSGKIDLLFLEAAVNDRVNKTDSITQVRDLEGIIRQGKAANPKMDIIMMSFADPYKNEDYKTGHTPAEITNHELVASRYGIPSINLAKEVFDKIAKGEFTWNGDFKDLHPSLFGQELYAANIKSLLDTLAQKKSTRSAADKLPVPLNKHSFTKGVYTDISNAKHNADWTIDPNWTPKDGVGTRTGFVNTPMLVANTPGAELSLTFNGTAVGMAVVSGPDAGIVSYSVDGSVYKQIDLFTEWSEGLHLPWYILFKGDLKPGKHTLKLFVADKHNRKSKGNACRIVHFLTNK